VSQIASINTPINVSLENNYFGQQTRRFCFVLHKTLVKPLPRRPILLHAKKPLGQEPSQILAFGSTPSKEVSSALLTRLVNKLLNS
jgi:hypothetical protein